MNIKSFKESLSYLAKAALTPFIWGHAGIGKTQVVKQWAEDNGYKFFSLYLGTQSDLGDILGLAEFIDNKDGTKSTAFATPKWLNDLIIHCNENPESGAVIFLDEFNRGRRDVLAGMFSLALDKTFHTIKLPANCHIIAAGNPPTDEYFTTDVNETALMARFVHIKLEPTVEEWVTYAKTKELEPSLIGFIQEQPKLLEDAHTDFQLPVKVDRRSYERASKLFALKTPQHLISQLLPGIIGLSNYVAYEAYVKESDKVLTGEQVLAKDNAKLVTKWSNPENVQASFLNVTCDNLKELLSKKDEAKVVLTDIEKANLMWFINAIPKDISYRLIKELGSIHTPGNVTFKEFYQTPTYEDTIIDLYKLASKSETKGKKSA